MDKWLRNVNVVRVVALLLGILLWAVVRLDIEQGTPGVNNPLIQTDNIIGAKITAVGLDAEQYYLRSIEPAQVDITVEGTSLALNKIPNTKYAIVVDLSNVTEGVHQLPLRDENFPSGVDVKLNPSTVQVVIDKMDKKQLDVGIQLNGSPAPGLKVGVPVPNPTRVHVTMPSNQLDQVISVGAEVDLAGASDTIRTEVKLQAYGKDGKVLDGVTITPAIVSVEVPIMPPFKSVPLQIAYVGEPPNGLSVNQTSQSVSFVTIYGPEDVLDTFDFYNQVEVDLSQFTGDGTVTLDIPLYDQIVSVEPQKVNVEVDFEPTVTRTFQQVPIKMVGVNDAYEVTYADPASSMVTLTLRGAKQVLDGLTASDVQVILDVSNLSPGGYALPLKVNVPKFVKLGSDENLSVNVEVTESVLDELQDNNLVPTDTDVSD